MLSLTDIILTHNANLLRQGAVLVDPADPGEQPHLLYLLTHEVKSGDGQVLSRRLHFVRVEPGGGTSFAGWAPHLDLLPLNDADRPKIQPVLDAPWLRDWLMSLKIPIGISDFRMLRSVGAYYIDKTDLIRDLIDLTTKCLLLPRPRRFGRTLNLSMLRAFFEKTDQDISSVFEGLKINSAGPEYQAHFQRYPVIYLTFKDVKATTFADCLAAIKQLIADECDRHWPVLLN